MIRDPWVLLGVSRDASDKQIKTAYREQAKRFHPDRNRGNAEAAARFQELSQAYEAIQDQGSREAWIATHESVTTETSEFGSGDLSSVPREIVERIPISFRESFEGTSVEKSIEVDDICSRCGGSGAAPGYEPHACQTCGGTGSHRVGRVVNPCRDCGAKGFIVERPCGQCDGGRIRLQRPYLLKIPPGVQSGYKLRVPGARSARYSSPDLVFIIDVQNSEVFQRTATKDPSDLLIDVPISYNEACFGAQVTIPTLDKPVSFNVPAGTHSGKVFKVSGYGMPRIGASGRGDLYARVQIAVPTELGTKQRLLIKQLGANENPAELRAHLFHE